MADRNTSIHRSQLKPVRQDDLDATNVVSDNQLPSYDLASGKFTWVDQSVPTAALNNIIRNSILADAGFRGMDDGFTDGFEDETGVDNTLSLNETYDASGDFYYPAAASGILDCYTLLHFNNDLLDTGNLGGSPHTYTNTNTTSDTTNMKWGSGSRAFNGSTAYLSAPDSNDWDIIGSNSDSWTIDFWIKMDTHSTTETICGQRVDGNNMWAINHNHSGGWQFFSKSGGTVTISFSGGGEITDTNWHHVALIKVADEYAFYVDGTQVNYLQDSSTGTYAASLIIGMFNSAQWFDGNLDEFRISNDNYFSAAPVVGLTDTIAVPTEQYNGYIYTQLSFDGDYVDEAVGGNAPHTFTNYNTTSDTTNKKWGTASRAFNGSSAYLTAPDSADWDIIGNLTDSWTIDMWVKHTDHVGIEYYMTQYENSSNRWYLAHIHGNGIGFGDANSYWDCLWGGEITDTNWHHIAVCKVANEMGLYKDGVQVCYKLATNVSTFAGTLYMGKDQNSLYYFDGNIDEFHIANENTFSASPNVGLTDTISTPTAAYPAAGVTTNMTLISEDVEADAEPTDVRCIVFIEPIDTITINTDVEVYASLDDGSTYEKVTMAKVGDLTSAIEIWAGTEAMTDQSDKTMRIKCVSTSNEEFRVHGWGMTWA